MRTHHRCIIRVSLQLLIISMVFLAVTVPSLSASSEKRTRSMTQGISSASVERRAFSVFSLLPILIAEFSWNLAFLSMPW